MFKVILESFNHKDITLGNEIIILKGKLEEDERAILVYLEASDRYELRFEILLERLGEYPIRNNRDFSLIFEITENCAFSINPSSQQRFFVE